MADIIDGDDGLIAEIVRTQTKTKHERLQTYVSLSGGPRNKFRNLWGKPATYVDLFCGTGRAQIEGTQEWVDGSALVAWKTSRDTGSPFSSVFIADIDDNRRKACATRLRREDAPVVELPGDAVEAASSFVQEAGNRGLHFAFIDPYNLETLNFRIIQALSVLERIDMMVHFSKMDHTRNLDANLTDRPDVLDSFSPGWRDGVITEGADIDKENSL